MPSTTAPSFTYRHSGTRSGRFPESDALLVVDGWMVFGDTSLNRWEVFVDARHRRTFVNPQTWASFDGAAELAFEDDFIHAYADKEDRTMRFICLDSGPYAAAARAQAAEAGTDAVRAKDRITDLGERAAGLVVQAASLMRTPTETQLQVFAVRHAQIMEELAVLEAEMERLRSKIGLATVALVDASTP